MKHIFSYILVLLLSVFAGGLAANNGDEVKPCFELEEEDGNPNGVTGLAFVEVVPYFELEEEDGNPNGVTGLDLDGVMPCFELEEEDGNPNGVTGLSFTTLLW